MADLNRKTILLIVGGGIAAFKALDLVRRLRERGAVVIPVMTDGAKRFITPLSLASLAGAAVHEDLFAATDATGMDHIELSRAADLVVVVPATANLLAKMAAGLADDLASTLLLATDKRVLVAPAMNVRMWMHRATRRNVSCLQADGVLFSGPVDGTMACGEYGPGRMSEPAAILAAIEAALDADTRLPPFGDTEPRPFAGRRVIVTSGPTHEPIDAVRFIANRSSGKQGHAIAHAAANAGADVVLVSGPVTIPDPPGVVVRHVETAAEMLHAVEAALPADVFIAAAAVADWRVVQPSSGKLKKASDGPPTLGLVENPDILAAVAKRDRDRPALVVGFAAETENLVEMAKAKLRRKGCDLIVSNDVGPGHDTFGGDNNSVTVIDAPGDIESWPRMSKQDVARRLVRHAGALLAGKAP